MIDKGVDVNLLAVAMARTIAECCDKTEISQIFKLKSQNRNLNSLLCEIFTNLAVKVQKSGTKRDLATFYRQNKKVVPKFAFFHNFGTTYNFRISARGRSVR